MNKHTNKNKGKARQDKTTKGPGDETERGEGAGEINKSTPKPETNSLQPHFNRARHLLFPACHYGLAGGHGTVDDCIQDVVPHERINLQNYHDNKCKTTRARNFLHSA
jgi:hypothetical protein